MDDAVTHGQLFMHVHQNCRHVCIVLHVRTCECVLTAQDNNSTTLNHQENFNYTTVHLLTQSSKKLLQMLYYLLPTIEDESRVIMNLVRLPRYATVPNAYKSSKLFVKVYIIFVNVLNIRAPNVLSNKNEFWSLSQPSAFTPRKESIIYYCTTINLIFYIQNSYISIKLYWSSLVGTILSGNFSHIKVKGK